MTKSEKDKCEKLIKEAIKKRNDADLEWEIYEKETMEVNKEVHMRNSDCNRSYAEGIFQALAVLGYQSDSMNILGRMIW